MVDGQCKLQCIEGYVPVENQMYLEESITRCLQPVCRASDDPKKSECHDSWNLSHVSSHYESWAAKPYFSKPDIIGISGNCKTTAS